MKRGEFMVELKGYHGTLDEKANKILNDKFIHSTKDSEWLGFGVYFFTVEKYARWWASMEANKKQNYGSLPVVLAADILTEEALFWDLDLQKNMLKMQEELRSVLGTLCSKGEAKLSEAQLRCACCNFFAKKYKIKVFAYTFPSIITNELGFPYTRKQRQLCVRDDKCITNLHKCRKGEI